MDYRGITFEWQGNTILGHYGNVLRNGEKVGTYGPVLLEGGKTGTSFSSNVHKNLFTIPESMNEDAAAIEIWFWYGVEDYVGKSLLNNDLVKLLALVDYYQLKYNSPITTNMLGSILRLPGAKGSRYLKPRLNNLVKMGFLLPYDPRSRGKKGSVQYTISYQGTTALGYGKVTF